MAMYNWILCCSSIMKLFFSHCLRWHCTILFIGKCLLLAILVNQFFHKSFNSNLSLFIPSLTLMPSNSYHLILIDFFGVAELYGHDQESLPKKSPLVAVLLLLRQRLGTATMQAATKTWLAVPLTVVVDILWQQLLTKIITILTETYLL